MTVIMNKIPNLLDALSPEQASAAAEQWVLDNSEFIAKVLEQHRTWLANSNVEKYQAAYDGDLESINEREKSRGDDVNHKLQVNYAQSTIDIVVDYLLGKPPVWTIDADHEENVSTAVLENYRKEIISILRSENAQRVLSEQLRQGSIAGYSTILSWVDEYGTIDFEEFPVQEVVPVYDSKGRIRLMIRYYDVEDVDQSSAGLTKTKAEIHDSRYTLYVEGDQGGTSFKLDPEEVETGNPIEHKAATVPGSLFLNGTPARHEKRRLKAGVSDLANGVFTLLESLAHAYSDKANSVDRSQDAYLLLKNVDTDKNEVMKMRQTRSLVLKAKESDASFISPSQNDTAVQNFKQDLIDAIHDMTMTPKLNDIGGATATEIKMRYAPLDVKASKKETYFISAVKQLVHVITDMINWRRLVEAGVSDPWAVIRGTATSSVPLYDSKWLQPTLNRNLPQNNKEIAEIVSLLSDKVPDIYLYELLWFVDDPQQVVEDIKKQRAERAKEAQAAMFGSTEFVDLGSDNGGGDDATNDSGETQS